jgi:hypothetical protein
MRTREPRHTTRREHAVNLTAILRLLVSAALVLPAALTRAQLDEGAGTVYAKDSYPTQELVRQPLTLSRGLVEVAAPVRFELSKDDDPRAANWSLPASLDFGVSDGLQVGVFHSTGVCPGGGGNDCADAYDDVGGRVRIGLLRSDPSGQLALEARVLAFDFSDVGWSAALGLHYKHTLGPSFAVVAGADWTTLLNDRSDVAFTDAVAGALGLQIQIFPGLSIFGNVGVDVPFNENAGFDAKVAGPVNAGIELAPIHALALGADVLFSNVVGEEDAASTGLLPLERFNRGRELTLVNLGRADERFLTVYARIFL